MFNQIFVEINKNEIYKGNINKTANTSIQTSCGIKLNEQTYFYIKNRKISLIKVGTTQDLLNSLENPI